MSEIRFRYWEKHGLPKIGTGRLATLEKLRQLILEENSRLIMDYLRDTETDVKMNSDLIEEIDNRILAE